MTLRFSTFAVGACLAVGLFGAEAAGPSFHAGFDGTCSAADGAAPVRQTNLTFVAGLDGGRAVRIPADGWLEYAFPDGALTRDAGSFIGWMRLDWTPDGGCEYRDHCLDDDGTWGPLLASGRNRSVFLLGDWRGVTFMLAGTDFSGFYVEAWGGANIRDRVHAGEWHQYAFTYGSGGRFRVYLDGFLLCEKAMPQTREPIFPKTFLLGCGGRRPGSRGPRPSLDGAFDDVRLWSRELSREEIEQDWVRRVPYRLEALDWSVWEGETKSIRFRVRNLGTGRLKRRFPFSDGRAGEVDLAPGALGEFAISVTGGRPGQMELVANPDGSDRRVFELRCLARDAVAARASVNPPRLVAAYDCTRDYPSDVFNECGSTLVTNACGVYREGVRLDPGTGFLYRFRIAAKGRPHRLVITYPNDAKREFSVAVFPENFNRLHTGSLDCAGILTGVDQPFSRKMQKKELLFWPDSDTVSVGVIAYRTIPGSRPPAVARLELHELDALDEAPRAGAAANRRSVAIWDEDPTMDAQLVLNHALNYRRTDLGFWETKWRRTIDYMRHEGIDAWTIKALSYDGDVTDMTATFGDASPLQVTDGRCPGWAELGADMLDRAGMDVWIRYNHKANWANWIGRLGGGRTMEECFFRDARGRVPEHYGKINFLRPEMQRAFVRIIRAYRDKFKVYRHFRGITMNEAPGPYFTDVRTGYDDWTVDLFARETGHAVPPGTPPQRFAFLMGAKSRDAWLDWRCRKVEENARRLVAALRDDGGAWELQFWIASDLFCSGRDDWFGWDPKASLRKAGVDLNRLSKIDGLRLVPLVRPDYFRPRAEYDSNEPFFPYHDAFRRVFAEAGVTAFNLFRHSNLEIYPSMTAKKNVWLRPFWMPVGHNVAGIPDFYDYPTPHPPSNHALESAVGFVADWDAQDLFHGFWGLPESGEHETFRRFYTQFRAIPRGKFDRVKGIVEPVALRVGAAGYYFVNREAYPIDVAWRENGRAREVSLAGCEIRFYPTSSRPELSHVSCRIPSAVRTALSARVNRLENRAASTPGDRQLADIAARARAAFAAGRYTTVRALWATGPARMARLRKAGVDVPRTRPPKLVWVKSWKSEDPEMPSHWFAADWNQVDPDPAVCAANKKRLGGKHVGCAYSFAWDPGDDFLRFRARVAGGEVESVRLVLDPRNDDRYDDVGFSPDDVVFSITNFLARQDGEKGVSCDVPLAALKGFAARPGAELAFDLTCRVRANDAAGTFPVSIGLGPNRGLLRFSKRRTGSSLNLSLRPFGGAVSCPVAETNTTAVLSFVPESDAALDLSVVPSWAGVGRVEGVRAAGGDLSLAPGETPKDLASGRNAVRGTLTVKRGVPVRVTLVAGPREEWPDP